MSHTIKLDIYYFSIRKITKTEQRKVKDSTRTIYKTDKKDSTFGQFARHIDSENIDAMALILQNLIKGFDCSFKFNAENTQGISITTKPFSGFNSSKCTIWGLFKGGTTGLNQEVYSPNNALKPETLIDASKIASLNYFFKIWLPLDSNVGVLFVQSYTSIGCCSLFKDILGLYFIQNGYKVTEWLKFVPQQYIDEYLKNGYIHKIQVVSKKKSEEQPLNPIFETITKARYKTIIDNFRMKLSSLLELPNYKQCLKEQIKAIATNYKEDEDGINIFYVDKDGNKLNTTLANIEDILPNILLDEDMMDNESHQPKWDEINNLTDNLLEDFKKKIQYSPQLI